MDIRTVTVEFLRAGPRHNQLISPLTQYLGVCGNAPAGRVSLPYEHGDLELRLHELRYRTADEDDPGRRARILDRTGQEIAQILSSIPGISGVLNPEDEQSGTLTHLRVVISASELAMLPFEASKVPTGEGSATSWLALHARAPVCITRHIRSVSAEGMRWPTQPRILFVAGPDTSEAFDLHRRALEEALVPWRDADGGVGERLVVLAQARLTDVARAISSAMVAGMPFSHVHILAHGTRIDDADRYSPVGLLLCDDEIVSGRQLATSLVAVAEGRVSRPAVVTLATCDSGQVADVRTADASVAHDLHDQGIPLVIASQFPLSVAGSVPFVQRFYQGQLWGEHPLVSLYALRLQLHSGMGSDTHDWASLVAYEAFPSNLKDQLEDLRYWQSRRSLEGALRRLEALVPQQAGWLPAAEAEGLTARFDAAIGDVEGMAERLPRQGPYALECAGLRAAADKRIAQAAFQIAAARRDHDADPDHMLAECLNRLDAARAGYWRATKTFLGAAPEPVRRKANLHWLLGQVLSLDVVLGRPLDKAYLMGARLAAEIDLESPADDDRAWAQVSLAEFALLRLTDPQAAPADLARDAEEAVENVSRFLELVGRGSEHASTSSRQFGRYIDWWGNQDLQWALEKLGIPERPHWHAENGIVPVARRILEMLRGRRAPLGPPPTPRRRAATAAVAPARAAASTPMGAAGPQAGLLAVEMMPAENGDCMVIEYGDAARPARVLIDCGAKSAVRAVAEWVRGRSVPGASEFELFVLTHIDADHISGVSTLFDPPDPPLNFADIWFNGWHQLRGFLSVSQGEAFSRLLADPRRRLPWNKAFSTPGREHPAPVVMPADGPPPTIELKGGLRLTILSPGPAQLKRLAQRWQQVLRDLEPQTALLAGRPPPPPVKDLATFSLEDLARKPVKKDTSVANGSSIALLAEYGGRAVLMTGDAHADVLVRSIQALQHARGRTGERLKLDALKLSHHGSANATTVELLEAIDCRHFLVSTDGSIFRHPDRESIARVIVHGGRQPVLHFNYRSTYNDLWDEPVLKQRYGYSAQYPDVDRAGARVVL